MSNKFQSYPDNNRRRDFGVPAQLPLMNSLGIYARQSTKNQVLRYVQSGSMQTEDLVDMAKKLGWVDEQIILFLKILIKMAN